MPTPVITYLEQADRNRSQLPESWEQQPETSRRQSRVAKRLQLGGTGVVAGVSLSATGEGALVGVPLAVVSAPVAAHGAVTATEGAAHLGADAADAIHSAMQSSSKETGSYTNTHESGKTYDGKGSRTRSRDSGKEVEQETGNKHVATEWKGASNNREAFKDESRRLDTHGGPNSSTNYNKIQSPGAKYRKQDGSN